MDETFWTEKKKKIWLSTIKYYSQLNIFWSILLLPGFFCFSHSRLSQNTMSMKCIILQFILEKCLLTIFSSKLWCLSGKSELQDGARWFQFSFFPLCSWWRLRQWWFGKDTHRELEVSWKRIKSMETLTPSSLEIGGDLCCHLVMPVLSEFVPLLWLLLWRGEVGFGQDGRNWRGVLRGRVFQDSLFSL